MKYHKLSGLLLIFLVTLLLSSCNKKQKDESVLRSKKYKLSILQSYEKISLYQVINKNTAFAIAVSIDNKPVWVDAFGFSDRELNIKASPKHKFRIGQLTEIITALTAAKLYEDGKLDLSKPVKEFIPEMASKPDITIKQLASHSSGLKQFNNHNGNDGNNNISKVAETIFNEEIEYRPGDFFVYSQFNYDLIAHIIEKTTNNQFKQVVKSILLDTLKLENTEPDNPLLITTNRVRFYDFDYLAQPINSAQIDLRGKEGSVGYLSNVTDIVKLGNQIIYPGFLKAETLKLFKTNALLNSGENSMYSFGLIVSNDRKGRTFYVSIGLTKGGSASLIIYPEDKLVIAMASNVTSESTELPILEVAGIFLDQLFLEKQ